VITVGKAQANTIHVYKLFIYDPKSSDLVMSRLSTVKQGPHLCMLQNTRTTCD